jgi:2-polyprenyl-3-methyl-5-hydroxy-6-metoxy-1,4-benzoquinol methylase
VKENISFFSSFLHSVTNKQQHYRAMSETHHHHHHDFAVANAKHFSEHAQTYRSELALELAKRSASAILHKYPFDPNQTEVLDFACGPGLVGQELLSHVKRLVGADSAQGMVDVFKEYVTDH